MPLVQMLEGDETRKTGDVVKVDGPTASSLVREGRAVIVREQRQREQTRK